MKLGGAGQVLLKKIMDSGYDVWIPDYGSAFPLFSSERFFRVLLQLLILVNWYLTTSQEEHRVRVCDKGGTEAWARRVLEFRPCLLWSSSRCSVFVSLLAHETHMARMYETSSLMLSI